MAETKILDATPGVIARYALSDEQALLAILRYSRMVDIVARYIGVECVQDPVPQSWIHDADSLLLKWTPARTVTWYSARKPTNQA